MKIDHIERARALADRIKEIVRAHDTLALCNRPIICAAWVNGTNFVLSTLIDSEELKRVIINSLLGARLLAVNELAELGVEVEP